DRGWIEARRRFIQQEQLRSAAKRQEQRELRPRAARQRFDLSVRRQVERATVALLQIAPPAWIERGSEANHLLDGHVVEEVLVLAHEGRAVADLDAVARFVRGRAEHAGASARRPRHPEQDLDRRRLARPVATEEPTDRSGRDL